MSKCTIQQFFPRCIQLLFILQLLKIPVFYGCNLTSTSGKNYTHIYFANKSNTKSANAFHSIQLQFRLNMNRDKNALWLKNVRYTIINKHYTNIRTQLW